jgi:hypothetical protein
VSDETVRRRIIGAAASEFSGKRAEHSTSELIKPKGLSSHATSCTYPRPSWSRRGST